MRTVQGRRRIAKKTPINGVRLPFGDKVKSMTNEDVKKIIGGLAQTDGSNGAGGESIGSAEGDIDSAPGCLLPKEDPNCPEMKRRNAHLNFRAFFLKNSRMGFLQAKQKWKKMLKKKKNTVRIVSDSGNYTPPVCIKMQKRSMPSPAYCSTIVKQLQSPASKSKPRLPTSLGKTARIVTCEPGQQQALNVSCSKKSLQRDRWYIFAVINRDKDDAFFDCSQKLKSSNVLEQLKSVVFDAIDHDTDVQILKETSENNQGFTGPSKMPGESLFSVPVSCEGTIILEDHPAPDTDSSRSVASMERANDEVFPDSEDNKVTAVDVSTKLLVSKALLKFASDLKIYADTCIRFLNWSSISIQGDMDSDESSEDVFVNLIYHCHDKIIILLEFLALLDRKQIINLDESEICNVWLLHDALMCMLQAYLCCSDNNSSSPSNEHLVSIIITIAKIIVPNEGLNIKQWAKFMKIIQNKGRVTLKKFKNLCKCCNLFAHLLKNRKCRLCEVFEFVEGESTHPSFGAEPVELLLPRLSLFLRNIEEWSEEEYKMAFTKHSYQRFLCNSQSCLFPCRTHLSQLSCSCFLSNQVDAHGSGIEGTQSHPKNDDTGMCPTTVPPKVSAESLAVETESTALQPVDSATSSEDFHLHLDGDSESGSDGRGFCDTVAEKTVSHSPPNSNQVESNTDIVHSALRVDSPIMPLQSDLGTLVKNTSASDRESSETYLSTCLNKVISGSESGTSNITEVISNGDNLAFQSAELTLSMVGNKGSISEGTASSLSEKDHSTSQIPCKISHPEDFASFESLTTISLTSSSSLQSECAVINHGSQAELSLISSEEPIAASKRKHEDNIVDSTQLTEDLAPSKQIKITKSQSSRPLRSKLSLKKHPLQSGHRQGHEDERNVDEKVDKYFGSKFSKDAKDGVVKSERNTRFKRSTSPQNCPIFRSIKQIYKGPGRKSILKAQESKKSKLSLESKTVRFDEDKDTSILEDIVAQMLEAEDNFKTKFWRDLKGKKKVNLQGKKLRRVDRDYNNEIHDLQQKYLK